MKSSRTKNPLHLLFKTIQIMVLNTCLMYQSVALGLPTDLGNNGNSNPFSAILSLLPGGGGTQPVDPGAQQQAALEQQKLMLQQQQQANTQATQNAYNQSVQQLGPWTNPAQMPSQMLSPCLTLNVVMPPQLEGMCATPGPQGIGASNAVMAAAKIYQTNLETLNNAPNKSFGPACFSDTIKKKMQQLDSEAKNKIEAYKAHLKTRLDALKNTLKGRLNQMETLNQLLEGGGGKNLELDFNYREKMASCEQVLPSGSLNDDSVRQAGLKSIQNNIQTNYQPEASQFQQVNRVRYSKQLDDQQRRILNKVSNLTPLNALGILTQESYKLATETAFTPIKDIVSDVTKDFRLNYENKIELIKQEFGGTLPALMTDATGSFIATDRQRKFKDIEKNLKNDYLQGCVINNDQNFSKDKNQILDAIGAALRSRHGADVPHLVTAAKSVLDGSSRITDINQYINSFNSGQLKNLHISITPIGKEKMENITVSEYYKRVAQECEYSYTHYDPAQGGSSKAAQYKFALEKAKEIAELEAKFKGDLQARINEIRSCENTPFDPKQCVGDSGHISPKSSSFCIKHADTCAEQIQQCYTDMEQTVTNIKTKQAAEATSYNTEVEGFYVQANNELKSFTNDMLGWSESLKALFPGAGLELPSDIHITLPELALSGKHGLNLRDPNMRSMDQFESIIESFLPAIEKQAEAIGAALSEEDNRQQDIINEHLLKLDQLIQTCENNAETQARLLQEASDQAMQALAKQQGAIADAQRDAAQKQAEQQAEAMEKERESLENVLNACNQYDSLRTSPRPACESIASNLKSVSDAMTFEQIQIGTSHPIYADLQIAYQKLDEYCIDRDQSEKQKSSKSDEIRQKPQDLITHYCGNDLSESDDSAVEKIVEDLITYIPDAHLSKKSKIRDIFTKDNPNLDELTNLFKSKDGKDKSSSYNDDNYYINLKNVFNILFPRTARSSELNQTIKSHFTNNQKKEDTKAIEEATQLINKTYSLNLADKASQGICSNQRSELIKSALDSVKEKDLVKFESSLETNYKDRLDELKVHGKGIDASLENLTEKVLDLKINKYEPLSLTSKVGERKLPIISCESILSGDRNNSSKQLADEPRIPTDDPDQGSRAR